MTGRVLTGRVVYVYRGEGASEAGTMQLYTSLEAAISSQEHQLQYLSPETIIEGKWVHDAALLAIGGGYDRGLISALGEAGVKVIRDYVGGGGSYLGFCSGAYFACDYIEFDKGGPLHVCGQRPLGFFPGLCIGPVYPGFKYNSYAGAVAAPIDFWNALHQTRIRLHSYFNGGGLFRVFPSVDSAVTDRVDGSATRLSQPHVTYTKMGDHSNHSSEDDWQDETSRYYSVSNVEILARYSAVAGRPAAVVRADVGEGVAVLSGVHLEFNADSHPHDANKIIASMRESEQSRKLCFMSLLHHLRITCKVYSRL